jgi:3-oxoisoapionate decarboxylase
MRGEYPFSLTSRGVSLACYKCSMNRRTFLETAAALPALAQAARTDTGIKLGFDTYSLRAFGWKDMQLIDFAARMKCDTLQISDSADYSSTDAAHLRAVRDYAAKAGIQIDAGIGCICPLSKSWKANQGTPEQVIADGLRVAHTVGAASMRCFVGTMDDRRGSRPIEEYMDTSIKILRAVKSRAQDANVKIAIENHAGDMQAREVRTIIEEAGRDFVASCLDTGNPMWVMENPLVTLEILGPYAVTTHVRDSVVFQHPRGAAAQWVALGDGVVDWTAFFDLYRRVCPNALLQLEIITGRPPQILPYYERDWWKWFGKQPASEFVRFQAMAQRGHPYMGTMVIEDAPGARSAEFTAALREQQRVDLERSLRFAQERLGIGIRWKRA